MKTTSTGKLYYSQFTNDFKKYQKARIFFIHGNDTYQKDQAVKQLKDNFTVPEGADFDAVTFYADNCQASDVLENLEMLPFMSPFRFILLKNFESFKKSDLSVLEKYLKSPLKTSVLVITAEKLDNRTSISKAINSAGVIVECKKPFNSSFLSRWLDTELKNRKIRMEKQAMNFLVNNIELSYQAAENELEKLYLFTKGKKEYTLEDVQTTLGTYKDNSIYDLQRALGSRNLKLSQQVLQNMLSSEEATSIGVMTVSMLTRYFLLLWKILIYRERNFSDHEILQSHLPEVFYSFRDEYLRASRNFNSEQIAGIFAELLRADTELKSINTDKTTLFMLIYRVCTL